MRHRSISRTLLALLLPLLSILATAQPAAALNADYWRGGWRTPLGEEPHLYQFVIRGARVTGVYCRNCSDATTIGFIDGKWDEKAGITFTVTFPQPDGRPRSVDDQHAMLTDGRLIVTGVEGMQKGRSLTLIKDPRGADPGGAPAYHLPPGTPPAMPAARAGGPGGGGGGGGGGGPIPYWTPPVHSAHDRTLVRRLHRFQQWLMSFPAGHQYAELVSRHFDEVFRLINTNRRVAAVWHRNHGPTLVHVGMAILDDPDHAAFPMTIGGAPASEVFDRILSSWRLHGSPGLATDIDAYREALLALPGAGLVELLTRTTQVA